MSLSGKKTHLSKEYCTLIASYAKRFGETFEENLFWAARNYTLFYIGGI